MKLRKVLTVLLIAAAVAPAAFAANTVNAAEEGDPVSIIDILYGEDGQEIKTIVFDADKEINGYGAVSVAVPVDLNGYRIIINGDLVQSANINVGSGELIVTGDYYQSGGSVTFSEGGKLTVQGNFMQTRAVDVTGGTMRVDGEYYQTNGKLTIGSGSLTVGGKYLNAYKNSTNSDGSINFTGSYGTLNMTDDSGYFCVCGDVLFSSTENNSENNNCITAGTLELKGNFRQTESASCFDAKGTHKLILSGTEKQVLSFSGTNYSGFNILSSATNTDTEINGRISSVSGSVTVGKFEQYQTLDLNGGTLTVTGDMDVHGTVSLNKGSLNVGGSYVQDKGRLNIQDGRMTTDGDFRFQYKNSTNPDGSFNYTGSNAVLNMTNDSGYLCVGGDMYFYSTQNNSETNNYITAGTLELKGDFTQGNSAACFDAKGTHKVIFSGSDVQNITFNSPRYSGFNILSYTPNYNTNIKGRISKISRNVAVGNFEQYGELNLKGSSLKIRGDLVANGTIYANGGTLNVVGNYIHQTGKLKVQNGTVKVGKDLRFQYINGTNPDGTTKYSGSDAVLNMADDKGYMLVNGNMYFYSIQNNSSSNNYITAGTLELKGNFEQGENSSCFDAKGTHKLIISGKKEQILKFSGTGNSGFNILTGTNAPNASVKGRISKLGSDVVIGSFEQYQTLDMSGKTMTVKGDVAAHGTILLNAGELDVGGNYVQDSGKLKVQDGRMKVSGDLRFQYKNGTNSDGTINYTGSNAVLNMANNKGYLLVCGDMYFDSVNNDSDTNNHIKAGTLELKGNFTQGQNSACFNAKGTHKVILSGEKKQTVKFTGTGNSGFNMLVDTNNPDAQIIGRVSKLGSDVTVGSFEQYQTLDLNGKKLTVKDEVYAHGNVVLSNGTLETADYVQNSGKLVIGTGRITVTGDFRFQHKNSIDPDGTINYTGSTAVLNMTDDNGYMLIGGDMYFCSIVNNSETNNYITAGTLELKGNFTQGQNSACFDAKGTHKVILSGNKKQTVKFDGTGYSGFNILIDTNNPDAHIIGRISSVGSDCVIGSFEQYQNFDLNGKKLTVAEKFYAHANVYLSAGTLETGCYTQCAGILTVGAGRINTAGDFRFQYENSKNSDGSINYTGSSAALNMTDGRGYILVGGSMYFYSIVNTSPTNNQISAGTIEIKGNFEQGQNSNCFAAFGTHKTIFSGTDTQYASFGSTDYSCFNILDISRNPGAAQIAFAPHRFLISGPELVNCSVLSTSHLMLGDTVALIGVAGGGSGDYTYTYMYKKHTSETWNYLGSKKGSTVCVSFLTPGKNTEYDIMIIVSDSSGSSVSNTFTLDVYPTLVNESTVSTEKVTVDEPITITAASKGGAGKIRYKYEYKKAANTSWTTIKDKYITDNTATFTPTAQTDYDVRVTAIDVYGKQVEKSFRISYQAPLKNTSTVSAESITLGEKITLNGSASGGTGEYTYALMYKKSKNTDWVKIGTKYGTASTGSFTPTAATEYDIMINVRDSSGKTVSKTFKVNVTK